MKKHLKFEIIAAVLVILILTGILVFFLWPKNSTNSPSQVTQPTQGKVQETPKTEVPPKTISNPIVNAKSRVTKKPFGIYITPANSPVQPEKFMGYHTGTDFETTSQEANQDIPIYAICSGKIRVKEIVQGYGGVLVQDCVIENQPVTVLYGHLNIFQIQTLVVGTQIKSSQQIAILAPAKSEFSSGERKHLHLGIHKGTVVDYRGYVQNKSELLGWLDAQKLL